MGVDPPSFGGKGRGRKGGGAGGSGGGGGAAEVEQEKKLVMAFLERWKAFDWTSELDGTLSCSCYKGFSAYIDPYRGIYVYV